MFDPDFAPAAYDSAVIQFSNIVSRCLSHSSGLLYHGYDPTRLFPTWGNLTCPGHSSSIWGRAMGWTVTGLLLTLDAIPAGESTAAELRGMFSALMKSVLLAQDRETGAWWQVMDSPRRKGNFLESSATGLFAHAMARGVRLGYLDAVGGVAGAEYLAAARKAFSWLRQNAVLELGDGTFGYNLTVDVCSINSTTTFDVSPSLQWIDCRLVFCRDANMLQFYVSQPLKPNSLLGEVGAILTDIELMLLDQTSQTYI